MSSTLPQGYTVAQLDDKQWYPIEISRYYSADTPEGSLHFSTMVGWKGNEVQREMHFQRRHEAVAFCQQEARSQQEKEVHQWQRLTMKSDAYPDRCIHYIDLITEITGYAPIIHRSLSYYDPSYISVYVRSWRCSCNWHTVDLVENNLCIEDALEDAANNVYASYQACQCSLAEQEHALSIAI